MILQSIKKELILVTRDLHSLAVLFLLPVMFMLLMTYAMSEKKSDVLKSIEIYVENQQQYANNSSLYLEYLSSLGYQIVKNRDIADAKLAFTEAFEQNIFTSDSSGILKVSFSSRTSLQIQSLVNQHLQLAFARLKLHIYLRETGELDDSLALQQQMEMVIQQSDTSHLIVATEENKRLPVTAYSVPSWLIFGVYFIVLPISITLINEQNSGTLMRLKTFPINLHLYFLIKLLAFFCINLLQLMILSIIGLRIIPGVVDLPPIPYDRLWEILLVGCFVSLSAVCFAAVIAAAIKSFEQAVVLGGGVNIILAALSGFMVPLDVMPESLQAVAQYSPMYWSAELIKASMFGISNQEMPMNIARLCTFSLVTLAISFVLFSRKVRTLQWN